MNFSQDSFLRAALAEDLGWGDITTEACIPAEHKSRGRFIAKEDFVLCGLSVAARVFALLDDSVTLSQRREEGDFIGNGDLIAVIQGPTRAILTGERTALNLLQRLSGIATRTRKAVSEVEGYAAKICDTRKTTPGLRVLEKYAVRVGGGSNHRLGLSDGVLIKDNHIAASGSIGAAVAAVRRQSPHTLKIEVETTNLEEVSHALEARADIIMLDNMDPAQMAEAVRLIGGRALTEASGNMGDRSLRDVAATGVDLISIGALTHSVRAADISLRLDG